MKDDHVWEHSRVTVSAMPVSDDFFHASKLIFGQRYICVNCGSTKIIYKDSPPRFFKPNNNGIASVDFISCAEVIMEEILR